MLLLYQYIFLISITIQNSDIQYRNFVDLLHREPSTTIIFNYTLTANILLKWPMFSHPNIHSWLLYWYICVLLYNLFLHKNRMIKFYICSCRHTMIILPFTIQQICCNFPSSTFPTQYPLWPTCSFWPKFINFTSRIIRSINFLIERFKNRYKLIFFIFYQIDTRTTIFT